MPSISKFTHHYIGRDTDGYIKIMEIIIENITDDDDVVDDDYN
jgi:hypothetical protein